MSEEALYDLYKDLYFSRTNNIMVKSIEKRENENESFIRYNGGSMRMRIVDFVLGISNKFSEIIAIKYKREDYFSHIDIVANNLERIQKSLEGTGFSKYMEKIDSNRIRINYNYISSSIPMLVEIFKNALIEVTMISTYYNSDPSMYMEIYFDKFTIVFPFSYAERTQNINTKLYMAKIKNNPYQLGIDEVKNLIAKCVEDEIYDEMKLSLTLHNMDIIDAININFKITEGKSTKDNPYVLKFTITKKEGPSLLKKLGKFIRNLHVIKMSLIYQNSVTYIEIYDKED